VDFKMKRYLLIACFWLVACAIPGRTEFNAGVASWEKGDYDIALAQFNAAIQQNPDLAEAHEGLAECYVRKQMLAEAQKSYEKAKKLYDEGKFQDTQTEDNKKKQRVEDQLKWLGEALSIEKPASGPSSAAAPK
jgi:tetratricopeptide (TPR) repeat protein